MTELAFLDLIIQHSSSAQAGNAYSICRTIESMARQRRADLLSIDCAPDCKKYHPLPQVALLLNRSEKTVKRLIRAGSLEASARGRLVSHPSIRAYLDLKAMSVLSLNELEAIES